MPPVPVLARSVDLLLEAAVVPGFTRPGFHLRRYLDDWEDLTAYRMDGRNVLITGATRGIGKLAATVLARLGASVHSLSRSEDSARAAEAEIRAAAGTDDVHIDVADLSRPREVEAFAERYAADHDHLDVLVHNAGAFFGQHTVTDDGLEANAATYVYGPFVLTSALAGRLQAADHGRIVTVSTGGAYTQKLDVDGLEADPDGYRPLLAYAQTKRAQIALTHQWAQRLPSVSAHAMQPGWTRTGLVEEGLPTFRKVMGPLLRDTRMAADTLVYLSVADEPARTTGELWRDRRRRSEHRVPWTRYAASEEDRLWARCEERTGHRSRIEVVAAPAG